MIRTLVSYASHVGLLTGGSMNVGSVIMEMPRLPVSREDIFQLGRTVADSLRARPDGTSAHGLVVLGWSVLGEEKPDPLATAARKLLDALDGQAVGSAVHHAAGAVLSQLEGR